MEIHDNLTNITGWDENVPEVERYIGTVKERARHSQHIWATVPSADCRNSI